ncbi:GDSL-like Lipase/Acylhydrolase [Zhouia amylolytica]|uniref:GDSL-like Lipase/Acylhydrolase n=2 Tax=Zhouia amylolytica TaxID=376730 RepID=W2UM64_9FLAO|nr:lipase [Zhouia amylolytica]ETN95064.1 GDSL-like Lipase/Acylhydrolase [Zhouia amylolytica AD3]MCQ0110651.1 G-D-S-L family lipolytic protein [Zhouia amylolytica]SFS63132.1 GDSL-like Lipase/Acylhydrolase [Zhouia amylolytica]
MKRTLYILSSTVLFFACEPEFKNPVDEPGTYTSGDADFSNYVAVGNSLTAGYSDGTVYLQAQKNSYPSIMAKQFSLAGGGNFNQPLVNDNIGGLTLSGQVVSNTRMVLDYSNPASPTPVNLNETPTTNVSDILEGPFNNMGVPGAKIYHLVANGYGNIANFPAAANPYFIRMASNSDASVLEDALEQEPSFFSLWIGNNDILGYATSGGTGTNQTGNLDPQTYGSSDITDPTLFAGIYNSLLEGLTANGAKGAVANLPDITAIPFFTTVPYNAIPMDAATAQQVNQAYAQYNGGLQLAYAGGFISAEELQKRTIQFSAGQNAVVILDETLTDLSALNPEFRNLRQATEEDLILLTTSSVLGTLADPNNPSSVIGVGVPLNDSQVLIDAEVEEVVNAQIAYNTTIAGLADQYNLAYIDTKSKLNQLSNEGIDFNGGIVTNVYASGGGFSLDGVHPTSRGYAILANTFIEAINAKFNANIPVVEPGNYPTVFIK